MKAIYAGSFDPVTNAHLWIINRAKQVFNEVIVLVANNSEKQYTFSLDERLNMFPDDVKPDVLPSHQLLTEYALKAGAGVLIRGMRSVTDFEYEWKIADINRRIAPQLETFALFTPKHLAEVSSSTVKEIARHNGWRDIVSELVPDKVFQALKENKIRQKALSTGLNEFDTDLIIQAYTGRSYHNIDHLLDMFESKDEAGVNDKDLDKAILYHDYTETPDKSALLFEGKVREYILDTFHTGKKSIMTDLDLAILGKSPEKYSEYRAKVRQEYSQYSDDEFNKGRKEIMKRIKKDGIYHTEYFKQNYEAQALANLKEFEGI